MVVINLNETCFPYKTTLCSRHSSYMHAFNVTIPGMTCLLKFTKLKKLKFQNNEIVLHVCMIVLSFDYFEYLCDPPSFNTLKEINSLNHVYISPQDIDFEELVTFLLWPSIGFHTHLD